jgi:membrane protein implicated in regulation of membrane protease activity
MKPFAVIAVAFLSLIALLQLIRFLLGWVVTVHGVVIPVWVSGIAFVIAGVLAIMLWRESRR